MTARSFAVALFVASQLAVAAVDAASVTFACPPGSRPVCIAELTTTTVTTASTVPPTPTTLPPGDCNGPVTVVSGMRSKTYRPTIPAGGCIDATGATFLSSTSNKYPIQAHGGPNAQWRGGLIKGNFSRTLTWEQSHDINPTAFAIHTPGFLLEGLRVDVAGDGIKARAEDFTIRGTYLTWTRDDCIENVDQHSGVIEDSLFEECFVGMSTRGDAPGAPDALVIFRRNLLALVPMPGPDGKTTDGLGHGDMWKLENPDTPSESSSPRMAIHDNVFKLERTSTTARRSGFPRDEFIKSCGGNVLVWLGQGDPPGYWPARCMKPNGIVRDRAVWDAAVAQWKAAHPEVAQ